MTFEIFLYIVIALYCIQIAIFIAGLNRRSSNKESTNKPFVSIIIAARNEELNLPICLDSAIKQTYPTSLFEIIIVNDHSSDKTEMICNEYSSKYSFVRYINTSPDEVLRGKANALAQGIDHAKGEVILITDADCVVPETWVEYTAMQFSSDIDLLGGFTLQKATSPFTGMQSLDWAYILGMAASSANLGYPLGSIGNNLAFRKTAYENVGGYRKLKFSVTEDYTVVQAIVCRKKSNYVYPVDSLHLVESKPCADWLTLLRQKHRWGKGGLDMKLGGLFIMVIGFLMHTAPFIMLYWNGVITASVVLMIKFIADYSYLYQILRRLNRVDELRWFYWFELYFIFYVVALPFLVFFGGKVNWKGRQF